MIPFAMESHGAVGASARWLLFKLASKVSDISAQAFLQQTYARLSVALQSANAAIMVGWDYSVFEWISCRVIYR